jgi:UDP-glucose 4-epimerase
MIEDYSRNTQRLKSKNITLTGSHGYIGSHLRNLISTTNIDLKIDSDILDPNLKIVGDTVIHLAGQVKVEESVKNPTSYYNTNINGTINLLNKFEGDHFIFASTGAVVQLDSPYSISKKVCEDIIIEHCLKKNINFTIFRFYNVIGSHFGICPTNPDGLFYALYTAMTRGYINVYGNDYDTRDGTCVRDYVHVMEICESIKFAIANPSNSIESLGHGNGYTVLELIDKFKSINQIKFDVVTLPRRPGDSAVSVLSEISTYTKKLYTIDEMLKINF